MKKVCKLVILVAIASIFTTGVMGQTAKNDPNAIGIYQMTPEQSRAQLTGTAKWEGNVSRDIVLTESVEILNRYNSQLDWGFGPVDKDYFVKSVLPKLKTGTLDPETDDPLIGGKSGTDKISMNNNPDFTKDDLFWYWDVRSYNHPSETYRIYLYRVICNNPVEYFQKLEEAPLTVVKTDTVYDTIPQYITKVDSVPYAVYAKEEEVSATTPVPTINNYIYNYNEPSGTTGYGNGLYQPPYGGCYGSGWGFGMSWGFGSCGYGGYGNNCYGGFYGCQQPYSYQAPQPYYGGTTIIIEGDDITQTTTIHPWWPIGIGGNNDDGGPDEPDDDDDGDTGGPDVPDDDPDTGVLAGGDTGGPVIAGDNGNDGGPNTPDDGRLANAGKTNPQIVGADEFTAMAPVVKNSSKEELAYNMDKGEVSPSKPSPSKGDGVKQETKPTASDPKPGANQVGPKNTDTKPVAVAPNPGAGNNPKREVAYNQQGTEPTVSKPSPSKGNDTKQTVPVVANPKGNVYNQDYPQSKPSPVYQDGPRNQPQQTNAGWNGSGQQQKKSGYQNNSSNGNYQKPQKTFSGPKNPPVKSATRPTKTTSGKRGG